MDVINRAVLIAVDTSNSFFLDSFASGAQSHNQNRQQQPHQHHQLEQHQHQQQMQHKSYDFWHSITDERVNEYYLLRGGPSLILSIVFAYLYFVLSLGPKLMARKEKYRLNKLLFAYNLSMASVNLWLFIQGLKVSNYGIDTWGCGKFGGDIRRSPRRGIYLGYLFFLTKLIELLDTVFFVLRKKQQQITFLHVFHHSIVPLFCWIGIKLAPGGPNGFFPLVNSFIHVLMYTYYALSTLGERVRRHLWWKKYLTRLQMIQFLLVMINAAKTYMSKDCKFPLLFSYLQATIATTFFILFAVFYQSAYRQSRATTTTAILSTTTTKNNNHTTHNSNKQYRQKSNSCSNNDNFVKRHFAESKVIIDDYAPPQGNAGGNLATPTVVTTTAATNKESGKIYIKSKATTRRLASIETSSSITTTTMTADDDTTCSAHQQLPLAASTSAAIATKNKSNGVAPETTTISTVTKRHTKARLV